MIPPVKNLLSRIRQCMLYALIWVRIIIRTDMSAYNYTDWYECVKQSIYALSEYFQIQMSFLGVFIQFPDMTEKNNEKCQHQLLWDFAVDSQAVAAGPHSTFRSADAPLQVSWVPAATAFLSSASSHNSCYWDSLAVPGHPNNSYFTIPVQAQSL